MKDKNWDALYGKPSFSIPKGDPKAAARAILRHMKRAEIAALLDILQNAEQTGRGSNLYP